jgi:V8-like Glu-specific endopeptidase
MHRRVALLSVAMLGMAGALVPVGSAQAQAQAQAQARAAATLDHRPASGAASDPKAVWWSATDSRSERRTVLSYWTSQRVLAAEPYVARTPQRSTTSDWPTQGTPWATRGASTTPTRGTPWSVQGVSTSSGQQAQIPNSPGLRWTDGGAVVRTTGRVFFTTASGRNASCSGSAVTSENRSVVITAGHCVKQNGNFHRNWVFVPAFDNGRRPFGTWVATRLLTTPQWNAREDINFDVAAAVMAPLQGRTLVDVVGGQGIAFNQPRGLQMFSFGYPAAEPFDGSRLIYCSGRTFNDTVMTRDLGLRCNMTGGSSGGPWFRSFNESTGLGWVNSVNSFKYNFAPDFMFGPFFGNEAQAVYQAAQSTNAL